jgi:hypothetical protein
LDFGGYLEALLYEKMQLMVSLIANAKTCLTGMANLHFFWHDLERAGFEAGNG